MYLGLSISGDARHLFFWEPVLNRIKARLSDWNSRNLAYSGHLILLKLVMSSLPIYVISFFKVPLDIISSIKSILNIKKWGGVRIIRNLLGLIEILYV